MRHLAALLLFTPWSLIVAAAVWAWRRLYARNAVVIVEVRTPGVTLLSFAPRRRPWVRA